mgnify:CR=1 FL=1
MSVQVRERGRNQEVLIPVHVVHFVSILPFCSSSQCIQSSCAHKFGIEKITSDVLGFELTSILSLSVSTRPRKSPRQGIEHVSFKKSGISHFHHQEYVGEYTYLIQTRCGRCDGFCTSSGTQVRTMYDEVNRNNRTNEVGIEINGCVCVSLCQSSHTSALRRDCISSSLRRLVLMWIERILRSHEDDG